MTISQITNYVIFGTQSDTKPLTSIPTQTLFFEIDTGRTYKYTGGVWSLFSGDNKQETLTNKTLVTPIIAAIKTNSGANTVTLPTTTDTLVGRNTNDTLANKTLTLPSIASIANGGVLTLPTGNRTLVARDTADPLLNKTINVNSNTITATSQAVGDILKNNGTQFLRMARGTTGQVLSATGSDLAWIDGASIARPFTSPFAYLIYKTGSTYKLLNNTTGNIDATTTTTPETLIQTAISAGGMTYVYPGTYVFSSGLSAITFPVSPTYSWLIMDPMASMTVPNAYAGDIFMIVNTNTAASWNNIIQGGRLQEAGTIARNWTGIRVRCISNGSTQSGCYNNTVRNVAIISPNVGIALEAASSAATGFINQNFFLENSIYGAKTAFIDFQMNLSYNSSFPNINRNRFERCTLQATNGTDATIGVKNIRHKENVFMNMYVVDLSGSQASSTIHTDAQHTILIGGTMDSLNYVDSSTTQTTKRINENVGFAIPKITPGNAGTNMDIISSGTTNTTSWYNSGLTERFYIQKNATQYLFDFVKQTSGGTLRPAIFRMYDVPAASPVESFRIDTDAIVKHATPIDLLAVSTPANPASNNGRLYTKAIDSNNDGLFYLVKKNGGFTEVQLA